MVMDTANTSQEQQTEPQVQKESTLKNDQQVEQVDRAKIIPVRDLVVWTAPARPFKRHDKQFYVTVISIASLVSLILFLAEGAMPVILIISLIFLYYVLSTVEPENIEYKVTNKGIKIAKTITPWEVMGRFWFGKRHDSDLLNVEIFVLPGRMELVLDPSKKEEIKKTLSEYLVEEEIPPSRFDHMLDWFSKKLPQ